jgi:hypothetical protein
MLTAVAISKLLNFMGGSPKKTIDTTLSWAALMRLRFNAGLGVREKIPAYSLSNKRT